MPQLDPETVNEILSYAFGMKLSPIYYRFEVIPADARDDLAFWLKTKVDFEGPPIQGIVDEIGADGVIERLVILDVSNDLAVEGRHRLAAALQYDLDVPAVLIRNTPGRGWRKLPATRTLGFAARVEADKPVLIRCDSTEEWLAVVEALDQYVANGEDYEDNVDSPDPKIVARVAAGARVLDRLNAIRQSAAEG
jgi:hypothetical protein